MRDVSAAQRGEQVVLLDLAGESHAGEISRVGDINRVQAITQVPDGPCFAEFGGHVVSLVDSGSQLLHGPAVALEPRSALVVGGAQAVRPPSVANPRERLVLMLDLDRVLTPGKRGDQAV